MTEPKVVMLVVPLLLLAIPAGGRVDPAGPAPGFELESHDGGSVSLADFADRTVVLEWFAHDCEFTWSHYRTGHMAKLQQEYTNRGVVWLTIDSNENALSPDEMGVRAEEWKMQSTAILSDRTGKVGRRYGVTNTPQVFVIHRGHVVYQGAVDDRRSFFGLLQDRATATNHLSNALDEVLAGAPVSLPETKPYGCSMKYADPEPLS